MIYAYSVTGLDFHAFMPLIESLIDSGDLQPGDTAIAYPNEAPSTKEIYVVATLPILQDTEEITTLDAKALGEVCHRVETGTYATWGNRKLFLAGASGPSAGQ